MLSSLKTIWEQFCVQVVDLASEEMPLLTLQPNGESHLQSQSHKYCPGETWNVCLDSLFSLVLNAPEADD